MAAEHPEGTDPEVPQGTRDAGAEPEPAPGAEPHRVLPEPGMAPDPLLPGQPAPVFHPPRAVVVSVWLWVAAGVLFVLGYLLILLSRQRIIDVYVRNNTDPRITPEQLANGTTTLLAILLFGAVVFALLYGLFAYKVREGTRSARRALTLLLLITLAFEVFLQLALQFASLITRAATLVAVVALILLYLPSAAAYFPKLPRRRPNPRLRR